MTYIIYLCRPSKHTFWYCVFYVWRQHTIIITLVDLNVWRELFPHMSVTSSSGLALLVFMAKTDLPSHFGHTSTREFPEIRPCRFRIAVSGGTLRNCILSSSLLMVSFFKFNFYWIQIICTKRNVNSSMQINDDTIMPVW